MNNYTVLLLRPDYVADEFGKDTCLAHVVANGAEEAQKMAQLKYAMDERDAGNQPEDYHVLFVALGHHQDLSI